MFLSGCWKRFQDSPNSGDADLGPRAAVPFRVQAAARVSHDRQPLEFAVSDLRERRLCHSRTNTRMAEASPDFMRLAASISVISAFREIPLSRAISPRSIQNPVSSETLVR